MEIFYIIIFLMIIIVVGFIMTFIKDMSDEKSGKYKNTVGGCQYLGGHPFYKSNLTRKLTSSQGSPEKLTIKGDNLVLESNSLIDSDPDKQLLIPLNKITEVEFLDDTQLQQKISLGRLVTLGFFALGLQKEKISGHMYLLPKLSDSKFVNKKDIKNAQF